jgi:hypothetical protein
MLSVRESVCRSPQIIKVPTHIPVSLPGVLKTFTFPDWDLDMQRTVKCAKHMFNLIAHIPRDYSLHSFYRAVTLLVISFLPKYILLCVRFLP